MPVGARIQRPIMFVQASGPMNTICISRPGASVIVMRVRSGGTNSATNEPVPCKPPVIVARMRYGPAVDAISAPTTVSLAATGGGVGIAGGGAGTAGVGVAPGVGAGASLLSEQATRSARRGRIAVRMSRVVPENGARRQGARRA
jgi:hypothetical protein